MRSSPLLGSAALSLFLVPALVAQGVERFPLTGREVAIYNLVGTMTVEGGTGSQVVVEVTRVGGDAARLKIETGTVRGRNALRVLYPEDRIVYSALGGGSRSTFGVNDDGTFDEPGDRGWNDRRRIEVRDGGTGLDAHADLRVLVPSGAKVRVRNGVGKTVVQNVEGTLNVSVSASPLRASHLRGSIALSTGAGAIDVSDVAGDLDVDAGSGGVSIDGVRGTKLSMDVGSGALRGRGIEVGELTADIGSGGAHLAGVKAPRVHVETGSGGSEIELLGPVDDVSIEAGSGGVTLRLPANTGAAFDIETGSGGIDTDFDVQVKRMERRALRGTVGDGKARVRIEAGSGTVKVLKN